MGKTVCVFTIIMMISRSSQRMGIKIIDHHQGVRMGAETSKEGGADSASIFACCDSREKNPSQRNNEFTVRMCGVGMGLDSQLLAKGRVRKPDRILLEIAPAVRLRKFSPTGTETRCAWFLVGLGSNQGRG